MSLTAAAFSPECAIGTALPFDSKPPTATGPPPGPVVAPPRRHKLATASDLPPELLSLVALYVGTADDGSDKVFNHIGASDDVHDLCTSSLVCLDWAKRCRVYLFRYFTVYIDTLADLVTMFSHAGNGSQRLTPLTEILETVALILSWEVSMRKQTVSSLLASIPDPESYQFKLKLVLCGPVPEHLPRRVYRSPPWTHSLPRSIPGCLLPISAVTLQNTSFPFFSDIIALLGRLRTRRNVSVTLEGLTWRSTDAALGTLPARSFKLAHRPRLSSSVVYIDAEGCTDDVLLSLHALCVVHPPYASIFAGLERQELNACMLLFRALELEQPELENSSGSREKSRFSLFPLGMCCIVVESCRPSLLLPSEEHDPPVPEPGSMSMFQPGPTYQILVSSSSLASSVTPWFVIECTGRLYDIHTPPRIHLLSLQVAENYETDHIPTVREQSSISSLFNLFHSQLSAFSHLREAKIETSRVIHELLADTVGTPPLFGGQLQYQWIIAVSSSFYFRVWVDFEPNSNSIQDPPAREPQTSGSA